VTRRFEHGPLNFGSMSPVIKALIGLNIGVFILTQLVGHELIYFFGLVPHSVTHKAFLWQPLTYLFLHASFMHLLFNLFALWMFGMAVESAWGPKEFLKFVLICGVGAGLINVLVEPSSRAPIIGASGIIYGLLVAFAMLFPDAVVYLYFFIPIKAKHMAILFGLLEFMASTQSSTSAVARIAHLGGMVIAFVYIRWWNSFSMYVRAFFNELRERGAGKRRATPKPSQPHVAAAPVDDDAAQVDRILDKILEHGEKALTDDERAILQRHSDRQKGGHA
jgi:membrane associated rhomboid family serine protease